MSFNADPTLDLKPLFDFAGAVLFLPAFESFVVAAFGLYSFACVWVFVDLHDTLPPLNDRLGARAL